MQSLIAEFEHLAARGVAADALVRGSGGQAIGLAGSSRAVLAASLFRELQRTMLIVTTTTGVAETWYSDLHALLRGPADDLASPLRLFPALQTLLYDDAGVDSQLVGQRLEAMEALLRGDPCVVVAPLAALLHRTLPRGALAGAELDLAVGQELSPDALLARLTELGYERHDPVVQPGQVAVRGGIVDVFPVTAPHPLRVEFWGDEIESLRTFEVNSQRSTTPRERATITLTRESIRTRALDAEAVGAIGAACDEQAHELEAAGRTLEAKRLRARTARDLRRLEAEEAFDGSDHYLPFLYDEVATLVDYLPPDAVILVDEPTQLALRGEELAREIEVVYANKLAGGAVLALPAPIYLRYHPTQPPWAGLPTLEITAEPTVVQPPPIDFGLEPLPDFSGELGRAMEALAAWREEGQRLLFLTHQTGRLRQILLTHDVAALQTEDEPAGDDDAPRPLPPLPHKGELTIWDQRLARGFMVPARDLAVLTDQELFGWRRARLFGGRKLAQRNSTALASLTELAAGDLVVHLHYGVGIYAGLVSRMIGDQERDFLQIDYAGTDKLFVPVTELDRVQRYLGPEGKTPSLNGLGDSRWRRTTAKAVRASQETARELLRLYARRSQADGRAAVPDTKRQHDVEAAFIYEETGDQLKAIADIKRDMERAVPMDRLLVGDVGYGKTEVAVRAAYKAVQSGWQVAVLAPTTILAQQHHATFAERLGSFGVRVEVLSRFRSRKEQQQTLAALREGEVQVVVGTHRLLSSDVEFKDLGLLVVDEEQRFGVKHKERIKEMRLGVDVLTMTATPIPRTLNAAMIGVRELSLLQEAPQGRRPVRITVGERREDRVREAILRELDRDGQVFFLHNRVRTIDRLANQIRQLVPTARVGVAHGQMSEDDLEERMLEMYAGNYDVLVCTTIIENGLDIPNVNTILVDDCDTFGLAQLYQLCGRVGRRERQAYAYLLHREHKKLTKEAEERLEVIEELSDLGSGFQIALRDLEIRGAGDLLGLKQSGFVEEVGYELYTQLLAEAVQALRQGDEEPPPPPAVADLDLPVKASLPGFYIVDEQQRIDLYRRLATVRDEAALRELDAEVQDRYGRQPVPTRNLFGLMRLKLASIAAGFTTVRYTSGQLNLEFGANDGLDAREMRIVARGLQRAVSAGEAPRVRLESGKLVANLVEPRRWEALEAGLALARVVAGAREGGQPALGN